MKFIIGTIGLLMLTTFIALVEPEGSDKVGAALAGYVLGTVAVPLVLAGIVLAVAKVMGKAEGAGAGAKVVFFTVAVVVAFDLVTFVGRAGRLSGPVTDAERQGLEIGPDSIRHRHFGFALPQPGKGFHAAPDMQRQVDAQFAKQPNVGGWAFRDTVSGGAILVLITKAGRVAEPSLRGFATGVRKGLAVGEGWEVLEDSVEWAGPSGEYRFLARHQAPAYLGIRCLPGRQPEAPVIVCVETVSRGGDDRLQFVRTGLAVGP